MKPTLAATIVVLLFALGGCRTDGSNDAVAGAPDDATPGDATPAWLVEPDERARAELRDVISSALGGDVLLSDDALTESSVLVIERRRHVDAAGRPIMGRDPGLPDRFLLMRQDNRCLLQHEPSGRRWTLDSARCVTAPD